MGYTMGDRSEGSVFGSVFVAQLRLGIFHVSSRFDTTLNNIGFVFNMEYSRAPNTMHRSSEVWEGVRHRVWWSLMLRKAIDNPLAFKIKDHDHSTSRESLTRDDRAYLAQFRAETQSQPCETGRSRTYISIGKYRWPWPKS